MSLPHRAEFDATAEALCERLCEIDQWVADAVVDQITEVFVEPSAPVHHLVRAAAHSPTTSPGVSDTIPDGGNLSRERTFAFSRQGPN